MHRLRRARGNYHVHRMFLQVRAKELHRRTHPSGTRIRHEEVTAYPQHQPLFPALFLGIDGIHPGPLRRASPHQFVIDGIRLTDRALQNLNLIRNLRQKAFVYSKLLGIGRSVNYRLPSLRRQILRELQPALHPRASGRRPVVGYDEHPTHRGLSLLSSSGAGRRPASGSYC